MRRSSSQPTELAYYRVFGLADTPGADGAGAGSRWAIEERIEAAQGEVWLEEHEVRRGSSWDRHISRSLLAQAFRVVTRTMAQAAATDAE